MSGYNPNPDEYDVSEDLGEMHGPYTPSRPMARKLSDRKTWLKGHIRSILNSPEARGLDPQQKALLAAQVRSLLTRLKPHI